MSEQAFEKTLLHFPFGLTGLLEKQRKEKRKQAFPVFWTQDVGSEPYKKSRFAPCSSQVSLLGEVAMQMPMQYGTHTPSPYTGPVNKIKNKINSDLIRFLIDSKNADVKIRPLAQQRHKSRNSADLTGKFRSPPRESMGIHIELFEMFIETPTYSFFKRAACTCCLVRAGN